MKKISVGLLALFQDFVYRAPILLPVPRPAAVRRGPVRPASRLVRPGRGQKYPVAFLGPNEPSMRRHKRALERQQLENAA